MSKGTLRTALSFGVAIGIIAAGSTTCAMGFGRISPTVVPPHPAYSAGAAPQPATASRKPSSLRIVDWFTAYDQIRYEAQMTPAEKSAAHNLMTAILTQSAAEKKSGNELLTDMIKRYTRASKELAALKPIPETAALQKGYQTYFDKGVALFTNFCNSLHAAQPLNQLRAMETAKHDLGFLHVSNNLLDKSLRLKYKINPYPYQ